MDLGEFVVERRLDVSVPRYCVSSCANYVFTTGRLKLLGKHAIVGFHGGANQPGILESLLDEIDRQLPDDIDDAERARLEAEARAWVEQWQMREADLLGRVGVDPDITVIALLDPAFGYDESHHYWVYSIEGLAHFGVHDVIVDSPPYAPRALWNDAFLLINDALLGD